MLKPEVAKKQLAQFRFSSSEEDESNLDRFLPAVEKLPKKLRAIGYSLLERNAKGGDEWEGWLQRETFQNQQLQALEELAARDRLQIFRIFFGGMAEDVEAAWQWMKSAPYKLDYLETPFRAPRSPEVTLATRRSWLVDLLPLAASIRTDVLTPAWLAAWVPYIEAGWSSFHEEVGVLLAAVMDVGGKSADDVFEILAQSARREHAIGAMGQHVVRALLSASRPEGWELMEKMLVAAQRQEGLRQVLLGSVVHAHPQAFRRMLQLIVDEGLTRFSSVVRAADEWLGLSWAAAGGKKVQDTLATASQLLEHPADRKKALGGNDAERAYLALWSVAFEDAPASIKPAVALLQHKNVEVRYVAALHLARLGLPAAQEGRAKALDDEDLRVALCALQGSIHDEFGDTAELENTPQLFAALERLLARMPAKPTKLKPLVWPWTEQVARRSEVSERLIDALGDLPPTRLLKHLDYFDAGGRAVVAYKLADQKTWDTATRDALLNFAGDASADVREYAFRALRKAKLAPADVQRLEGNLTRTAADLRNGVVSLIMALADKPALAAASRLLESANQNQRLAGLEVLRQLAAANRQRSACIGKAAAWREGRKKVLKGEQSQIDAILDSNRKTFTLDDALGLMDPRGRSKPVAPKKRKAPAVTAATPKLIQSLDELIHAHRKDKVRHKTLRGQEEEELLGEIVYGFPSPNVEKPIEQQLDALPLRSVWEDWYRNRPASLKDKDGLELLRARMFQLLNGEYEYDELKNWAKGSADRKGVLQLLFNGASPFELKYEALVDDLLDWLLHMYPPQGGLDFLLDVTETLVAMISEKEMQALHCRSASDNGDEDDDKDWRNSPAIAQWTEAIYTWCNSPTLPVTPEQRTRFWRLMHWLDEPFPGAKRSRVAFPHLVRAYLAGDATRDDVIDHWLGPDRNGYWGPDLESWSEVTARQPARPYRDFLARPEISDLVNQACNRIIEIELARGEAATVASHAALATRAYRGVETLHQFLVALGKEGFKKLRGWRAQTQDSREATLTEMASNTYPAEGDTPQQFADVMRQSLAAGHFPEERLLQLMFLAPQWAPFVEATIQWDGLSEGLYWFMAHMRYVWGIEEALQENADLEDEAEDLDDDEDDDDDDAARPRKLSRWERIIRERTPLTDEERSAGAIDVAWFHRTYEQLTPKRWETLAAAARFAATPAQAKRAQFIADVLLGKASKKKLIEGIRKKNLKENVRLLGLLPLEKGARRERDIAERYEALQDYRRYASKLSSMARPDALRACDIGLKNLASTAGYADPLRLQWAMEAESTKDLAHGPVSVSKGDVTMTLALDEQARPELSLRRGEKPLKSLPAALGKEKKFVELRERGAQLKRQAARVRESLEAAMCRGDSFTGAELMQLADHALLWPQLSRLVLLGEGIAGYPVKGGKALADYAGKLEPVKKQEQVRIAHPYDLLTSQDWDRWQHECFHAERLQPFKQVFRELYVITAQEKQDATFSRRYAGQQVNPRQAYALWGRRGWSVDEYENVWKAFHHEGLNVAVTFNYGVTTPLEVEGLTIDQVQFHRRDEFEQLKLVDVPPRIFSEVMRDLDLVVSVAHAGSVDPEASASTVEMRSSLLRETCDLLNLKNVKVANSRALIQGRLGEYSVHLGSGVVHRMPGGSVCIVPVHAQHRGRLFLPFADDDPRTAEVISKTLLLARDDEIDDPLILEQLRAKA